jgi:uncharacterized membrane protein YqjE
MAGDEPPRPGIFASLRRLSDSGLALLQNRVELFSVELEEQKIRLVRLLVLVAAAVFMANTAVLVLTATIILVVGDKARVPVMICLSLVYLGGATAAVFALRKEIKESPPPFDGTIAELKKDRSWLSPKN